MKDFKDPLITRVTTSSRLKTAFYFLVMGSTLALASCGGGSNVASSNGGIGGSGKVGAVGTGEITGFGSVIFDDSTFTTTADTQFSIDGVDVSGQSDLSVGMIASFEIAEDASSDLSTGTAQRINASTLLKGQVTSVTPLQVLGQTLFVTGSTVLADIPGNSVDNLTTSDLVEVYGIADQNNVIQATRIELKTGSGIVEWKLSGLASNVTTTTLTIGTQLVNINGATIEACNGGLSNGDYLEIKADHNTSFSAGDTLNMVSKVECRTRAIDVPSNINATVIPAQFEGIVAGYTGLGDQDFVLGDQLVSFSNATEFRSGTIEDLINGAYVEVEGSLDTSSGTLTAREIRFKQARIRIEAPLTASDVTPGVSVTIMGLSVLGIPATEDDDSILSLASGLPAQVEVRGFVDSSGTLYAERIRERGNVDSSDVRLRGPVDNISQPNLTILGIPVNASGAAGYFDLQGNSLGSIDALFNQLSTGLILEVEDAQLNAGPTISMDIDSTVQLED